MNVKQIKINFHVTEQVRRFVYVYLNFREKYGAKIYASAGEIPWIENIDLQYAERPIPNFYQLAGKSVKVDYVVKNQDRICLADDLVIEVVSTQRLLSIRLQMRRLLLIHWRMS